LTTVPKSPGYLTYVVLLVCTVLAIPLWREFREPGFLVWNVCLALFLIVLVAAVFLGVRHLQTHNVEVGEARFTKPNRDRD
jgi:hypothetical protein